MAGTHSISVDKLVRLMGTPQAPLILDVRGGAEGESPQGVIPGSSPRPLGHILSAPAGRSKGPTILVCRNGREASPAAAAALRAAGVAADTLEGGVEAWSASGMPLVNQAKLPPRDAEGRTRWITRERPKVDRIACPWLIRRFVDPHAVFLFVTRCGADTHT